MRATGEEIDNDDHDAAVVMSVGGVEAAESLVVPPPRHHGSIGLGKPPSLCTLRWSKISYTVTHKTAKTVILNEITGRCAVGEMTAIMGPSGCGKTTLLDILADRPRSGQIDGVIELDGVLRSAKEIRAVARYVAQEDAHLGCFTVHETLVMAANLTLSRSTTSDDSALIRVNSHLSRQGRAVLSTRV